MISSHELWFLDAAATGAARVDVCSFGIDNEYLNCKGLSLSTSEAAHILYRLSSKGLLSFRSRRQPADIKSEQELLDIMNGSESSGYFYALTALGGETWEREKRFDWGTYVSRELSFTEGECSEICGVNALEVYRALKEIPKFGLRVVENSESWKVCIPWPATNWKTFPVGVQVLFTVEEIDEAEENAEIRRLALAKLSVLRKNPEPGVNGPEHS